MNRFFKVGALTVGVMDEPGAGGANHKYVVMPTPHLPLLDGNGNKARPPLGELFPNQIHFQNGPVMENGINGLTNEVLLAIVADRLKSFQSGQYSCRENAIALTHVETAMLWLEKRTHEREARGVEGTSAK